MTTPEPERPPTLATEAPTAWRRYALVLGVLVLTALAGLAGLQLVVDPLGVHGTGIERFAPWRSLHFRGAKGEALARGGYDAVILGTSRAMAGFDPAHPAWGDRRVYDASLDGTNLWELEHVWRVAAEHNTPDRLLVETSLLVFGESRRGSADFGDSRLPTGEVRVDTRLSWLFGTRVLALATSVVRGAATGALPRKSVRPDGHREYRESPQSNRALFEGLLVQNFFVNTGTYNGFTFGSDRIDALERIVVDARDRGVRVDLVIPPVHVVQLDVLERMGLGRDLIRLRTELVTLVERVNRTGDGPDVRAWDFTGASGDLAEPIADEGASAMRYYYESSHFTAQLGGRVLDRVYDTPACDADCRGFGVDLATVDLPAHSARLSDDLASWRAANPDEVAWLDELEARTEVTRTRRLREVRAASGAGGGAPGVPR